MKPAPFAFVQPVEGVANDDAVKKINHWDNEADQKRG